MTHRIIARHELIDGAECIVWVIKADLEYGAPTFSTEDLLPKISELLNSIAEAEQRCAHSADLRHAGISLSRAAGSTADETARIAGHSAEMSERIYDERLERTAPIAALARARR